MNKILIVVEKGNNGLYSVYSPNTEFTVLNGQGATIEDAIADVKEALQEIIESYRKNGDELPAELTGNIEFEYKYDVASLFSHFDEINLSSFARKNGMNRYSANIKTDWPLHPKNNAAKLKTDYTG